MTLGRALRIDPRDNVAVALDDLYPNSELAVAGAGPLTSLDKVPFAHKVAIQPIPSGNPILKYGVPIAFATVDIRPGEWVHQHNAESYFLAKKEGSQ
jgi:hypothetical protein